MKWSETPMELNVEEKKNAAVRRPIEFSPLTCCDIPEFIAPWIDRFYEKSEIDLVLLLESDPMTAAEINQRFALRHITGASNGIADVATRAYQKGIINLRSDGRFEPANFHARFDKWAMFEGWKDIPGDVRTQLVDWELAQYGRQHADQVSALKAGRLRDPSLIYPEYILLREAETLLDLATSIYLMPCNCRSMIQKCAQSVFTCIRFENDRGLGWEISSARAKEIVRLANKKGLMQSGEVRRTKHGRITGAICNCCIDCCFPHKLAEQSNACKLWPLSRHVARHLEDHCIACGLCVKRCPFQAFTHEKREGKADSRPKTIRFDADLCRGCGVCCTACPKDAIEMVPLANRDSSVNEILQCK
jgi:Pyruvate/2-oxoacid:ferredoxin oxidoreductase delta subunit